MYSSNDITILDQIIKDNAKVPLIDNYGKKQVNLTETHGTDYSVTIRGIPDDTLIIKIDLFEAPKSLFQGIKGECKRCDYVIISDSPIKKMIVLIEMKAGKALEKEVIQQLKGGKCLVKYCQQIGQEFWREIDFLNNYDYRFISLKNISISKKSTRNKKQAQLHDSPENMLKIYSPKGLQFNQLIGQP